MLFLDTQASEVRRTFRLLDLPTELRFRISRSLLVRNAIIKVPEPVFLLRSITLLFDSKEIKAETESVFWEENTFQMQSEDDDLQPIIEWLNQIGKRRVSKIRKFVVNYEHTKLMKFNARMDRRRAKRSGFCWHVKNHFLETEYMTIGSPMISVNFRLKSNRS